jgi:hypothetical protein
MNDHVLDDLEPYALGAVDRADAERIASHLAACPACRAEAAALAEVVSTLPDSVALREPRGTLRERVLAAARADLQPAIAGARRRWSLGSVRLSRVAFAGLAAAAIVLGAVDVDAYRRLASATAERNDYDSIVQALRQGARVWYMSGKGDFAGSGGTLFDPRAEGKQPFVLFHDLPSIPEGKVLTIWLVSPDSTWARAATFRPNGRDVQSVQITMEVSGFERCAVTLENSAWGPRYGAVVMESRIVPPTAAP